MHRFYHSNPLDLNQIIILDEFSSHHALRVMRVKVDDFLILFNGDGFEYRGRVSDINKKTINVEILSKEKNNNESPININLFQSISSNEKMDMVIQKATELGVSSIQPIFTSRSTIKLSLDRTKKRLIHWRQVSISACEQSGRSKIPTIKSPIEFDQICRRNQQQIHLIYCFTLITQKNQVISQMNILEILIFLLALKVASVKMKCYFLKSKIVSIFN